MSGQVSCKADLLSRAACGPVCTHGHIQLVSLFFIGSGVHVVFLQCVLNNTIKFYPPYPPICCVLNAHQLSYLGSFFTMPSFSRPARMLAASSGVPVTTCTLAGLHSSTASLTNWATAVGSEGMLARDRAPAPTPQLPCLDKGRWQGRVKRRVSSHAAIYSKDSDRLKRGGPSHTVTIQIQTGWVRRRLHHMGISTPHTR